MTPYSVQSRDRIFVKSNGFLSFAKNVFKNIDKNMKNKIVSNEYSQILLDHTKKSATEALQLIKNTQQNNSETATNKYDEELPIDRYISRRKVENYWWSKIIIVA